MKWLTAALMASTCISPALAQFPSPRYNAVTANTYSGDAGATTVTAAGTATARTMTARAGEVFSIVDMGASTGAAAATNDAAIASAITLCQTYTYGCRLRVPSGRYHFSAAITATLSGNQGLVLEGDGALSTELVFDSDTDGIAITLASGGWWSRAIGETGASVAIENIGLLTGAASSTGTAIKILGDNVTGRPSPGSSYRNLGIHGSVSTKGWARGIYTYRVSQQLFDNIAWTGVNQVRGGIGIEIGGTHTTNEVVAHTITNYHATFFGTALLIDDGVQGVQVSGFNPVFGNIDIDWEIGAGAVEDGLSVTGSQLAYAQYGIKTKNIYDVILTGNYFLPDAGTSTAVYAENAGMFVASGNTVRGGFTNETGIYTSRDSSVATQYGTTITGNVLSNLGATGVAFGASYIGGVTVNGNTFTSVATPLGTLPTNAVIGVNAINGGVILGAATRALIVQGIGTFTGGHLIDSDFRDTTVVTGFNVVEPQYTSGDSLTCSGGSTLASGNVVLPPAPVNGQVYRVATSCVVTSFTFTTSDGTGFAAGINTARTLPVNGTAAVFKTSGNAWYPWQ